ncbi:erythromycin esterase family protein [Deinococcus sp. QL22]|uniref:erythromycin esterase family protein n=1 Tax=Deinococcus sp. QL22 TaxID=2939437 RepID=UPI002016E8A0|nr:erythromycin esterase family protein [Deinococcus sp. QL22]UQN06554.1 erythromycin esterase family protein [Deinococcus sp. QL22]
MRFRLLPLALLALGFSPAWATPANLNGQSGTEVVQGARREALMTLAQPITTLTANALNADFTWVAEFTRNVQIIGAGEGSHGSAEHFQFKDRLFRELVRQAGFTVLGIEAAFDDGYRMDQYVRGFGSDDPVMAMRQFDFWTWQTQEMRDLLVWMRQSNQTRGKGPELRVMGFDLQDPAGSLRLMQELAPDAGRLHDALQTLLIWSLGNEPWAELKAQRAEERAPFLEGVTELLGAVQALPPASPDREVLHSLAQTVRQASIRALVPDGTTGANLRDAAMAGNVRQLLAGLFPGQKAMLWAHNFHVSKVGAHGQPYRPMGSHLARDLGTRYRAIGLSYAEGEVRAIDTQGGPVPLKVAPARPESLDMLAMGSAPAVFIDLRRAVLNPVLRSWWVNPVDFAGVGALFTAGTSAHVPIELPAAFDGVILVRRSTASTLLSSSAPQR